MIQNGDSSPASHGGVSRTMQFEGLGLVRQRTEAATARTEAYRARGGFHVEGVLGKGARIKQIIANSTLWPEDVNRMIFIKDTSERITQTKKVIRSLDVPNPQVIIESRLVRDDRNWARGLGILGGGRNNQNGVVGNDKTAVRGITGNQNSPQDTTPAGQSTAGTNIPGRFAVNLPIPLTPDTLANNILGLGMQCVVLRAQHITELDFHLQLGEINGQTKTVTRPKVQVVSGQKAKIRDGQDVPYSTSSPQQGTQTQLVPAYLELEVKPTIYSDGRIAMDLTVKDEEPSPVIAPGATQVGVLLREAKTIMVVRDGERAVVGGITRETDNTKREGWPGLMNIPLLGTLFTNKGRHKEITELLIFITPKRIKRPPRIVRIRVYDSCRIRPRLPDFIH